jgi:hypothetical protein
MPDLIENLSFRYSHEIMIPRHGDAYFALISVTA